MRLPASGLSRSSFPSSGNAAAAISSGSAMRPMPASPASAISPAFGPTTATPSPASRARLRRVAGCSHIRGFIAGATRTGRSVASSTVEARSSACPPAILAMRSAVAGATTMRSASRASLMWPTSNSVAGSNRSVNTRSPESAPADSGVTNSCAARGENAAHGKPALLQPADEIERFVGGDAAADDQQDASRAAAAGIGTRLRAAPLPARRLALAPRRRGLRVSSAAAWRRMVRASSSIERPLRAARSRRRRFRSSSSWRMVMLAMSVSPRLGSEPIR